MPVDPDDWRRVRTEVANVASFSSLSSARLCPSLIPFGIQPSQPETEITKGLAGSPSESNRVGVGFIAQA